MSKVLQAVKNLIPMMLVTGAVITGSSRAQALSAYDLKCIAAMPTTTLLLVDAGETVQGQLIHHNGVEYMPIHSGVIVPNDLPILGRWATELKSLGPQQRFSFPKSKCTEHGGKVMKCIDEKAPVQILNGHKVRVVNLWASEISERSFVGKTDWIETLVGLEVDGVRYRLPMRYFPNECRIRALDDVVNL